MESKYRCESLALMLLFVGIQITYVCFAHSNSQAVAQPHRTLEILDVGYRLPVEILAAKNLNNEHWIRDLELAIKNSSSKPIYGLYADLYMPDDRGPSSSPVAVSLKYGRSELMHPSVRPSANDAPIGPGETVKLTVDEPLWRGYEGHLANDNVREQATYRLRLTIVAINFGDGTGFINGGVPYPRDPLMKSRPQRFVRVPVSTE